MNIGRIIRTFGRRTTLSKFLLPPTRYKIRSLIRDDPYTEALHRTKSIFIHVPKVAGTSIATALFSQPHPHEPYFCYEKSDQKRFCQYFKFAFVRNPWDRTVSTYFFLKKACLARDDRSWTLKYLDGYTDFRDFVLNGLPLKPVRNSTYFLPQSYFITRPDNSVPLNFLGRYENLADDFFFVSEKLGLNSHLGHLNASIHPPYEECYDSRMREVVAKIYERDIALFNYQFGRHSQTLRER
jgi:chondroitin 4-sulfotransferase 11